LYQLQILDLNIPNKRDVNKNCKVKNGAQMKMNTTLVEIPESKKSTLNVEQLGSLMGVALNELETKGQDVQRLMDSFVVQDDGIGLNAGELVERAERCKDPEVAMIRADNNCNMVNKLTETVTKIRRGDYDNHCTVCHEEIPFERLMCVPATTKCVPCKEKRA